MKDPKNANDFYEIALYIFLRPDSEKSAFLLRTLQCCRSRDQKHSVRMRRLIYTTRACARNISRVNEKGSRSLKNLVYSNLDHVVCCVAFISWKAWRKEPNKKRKQQQGEKRTFGRYKRKCQSSELKRLGSSPAGYHCFMWLSRFYCTMLRSISPISLALCCYTMKLIRKTTHNENIC